MKKKILIYAMVIISMASCTSPHRQTLIESNIVSSETITIETLNEGFFKSGVYKIGVDSNEYILVITGHGVGMIKHK